MCLVLCKDDDILDMCKTSPYQNVKYIENIRVTSTGDGVVKFIKEILQSHQIRKVGNQQLTQNSHRPKWHL